jgi:hypothetical protein
VKLTKLGARRLLKLATILDTADALHRKRGEPTYNQEDYAHSCGSPACALGHYAANTRGFKLDRQWYEYFREDKLFTWDCGADEEFGLSYSEAMELFYYNGCGEAKTAKQAAKYIRSFVKRKGVT